MSPLCTSAVFSCLSLLLLPLYFCTSGGHVCLFLSVFSHFFCRCLSPLTLTLSFVFLLCLLICLPSLLLSYYPPSAFSCSPWPPITHFYNFVWLFLSCLFFFTLLFQFSCFSSHYFIILSPSSLLFLLTSSLIPIFSFPFFFIPALQPFFSSVLQITFFCYLSVPHPPPPLCVCFDILIPLLSLVIDFEVYLSVLSSLLLP